MKHPPCNHEKGFCAMGQERIEDFVWAISSQSYITLLKGEMPPNHVFGEMPDTEFDIQVLVEAANYPASNYRSLYRPIAFVLRIWREEAGGDMSMSLNSNEIDFGTYESDMAELALATAELMAPGNGYYNDPDAS